MPKREDCPFPGCRGGCSFCSPMRDERAEERARILAIVDDVICEAVEVGAPTAGLRLLIERISKETTK